MYSAKFILDSLIKAGFLSEPLAYPKNRISPAEMLEGIRVGEMMSEELIRLRGYWEWD